MRRALPFPLLALVACTGELAVPHSIAAEVLADASCRMAALCDCPDHEGCTTEIELEPPVAGDVYDGECVRHKLEWIELRGCGNDDDILGDTALELAELRAHCEIWHGAQQLDEPCGGEDGRCDVGLVCDEFVSHCRPANHHGAVGEPCEGGPHSVCEPGSFCVRWGFGAGSRCEHDTALGGACRGPADDGQCDYDTRQRCDPETFTCVPYPRDGEACVGLWQCDYGFVCVDDTCRPAFGPGETCDYGECAEGLTCHGRDGVCVPKPGPICEYDR